MKRRNGFTLVEVLVVMGIILALISILLPAVNQAHKQAVRMKIAAQLQSISTALDAYRLDWGDYPRTTSGNGPQILCWALVAPGPDTQDGYNGPGFRLRGTTGSVKEPYLNLDQFAIATLSGTTTSQPSNGVYDDTTAVLLDYYGKPILYFPRNRPAVPTSVATYVSSTNNWPPKNNGAKPDPAYNANDASGLLSVTEMQKHMPGIDATGTQFDPSQAITLPFILWSAGPDGTYGSVAPSGTFDDVTNFQR